LAAGEVILVVGFDPVTYPATLMAFEEYYGVRVGTRVFGPWSGRLGNEGDRLELRAPDRPQAAGSDEPGYVPYVCLEAVHYLDRSPWPWGSDGFGLSLQRLDLSGYGNEPLNWQGTTPTPGEAPLASVANPRLEASFSSAGDELEIRWVSAVGQRYQIEVLEDLETILWAPWNDPVEADSATMTVSIPIVRDSGCQLYRVSLVP
jgi:hypothetical protein